jgi:tRNA wybutosine-synthesizing protein 3
MNPNFSNQKIYCLSKIDLSRKGSIDTAIVDLVQYLNNLDDYFTSSSCSGRLLIFVEQQQQEHEEQQKRTKNGCKWLMSWHDSIDYSSTILDDIQREATTIDASMVITMKFEPFIMHVQCRSIEAAQQLHRIAIDIGLRNSGMTIGKSGKCTLAIRSSLCMQAPLSATDGRIVVTDQYMQVLFANARCKFIENNILIAKFFNAIKHQYSINE